MDKDSIAELIIYPEIAKRAGVQGNVVIKINLDSKSTPLSPLLPLNGW